jgi:hypothetical protein
VKLEQKLAAFVRSAFFQQQVPSSNLLLAVEPLGTLLRALLALLALAVGSAGATLLVVALVAALEALKSSDI